MTLLRRSLVVAVVGVPAVVVLTVLTGGVVLTPAAGLLFLAPFVALNYLTVRWLVGPRAAATTPDRPEPRP